MVLRAPFIANTLPIWGHTLFIDSLIDSNNYEVMNKTAECTMIPTSQNEAMN
jgi:hypothetical protein